MTKEQRRLNQYLTAKAMGVPLMSYEAEIKATKVAREAAGENEKGKSNA